MGILQNEAIGKIAQFFANPLLAFDGLQVLFADGTLLEGEMPLVGSPPISVQSCFTKGFLSISSSL
jgi:hypothetical protein